MFANKKFLAPFHIRFSFGVATQGILKQNIKVIRKKLGRLYMYI